MSRDRTATYLYGIVAGRTAPRLPRTGRGLPDTGPPRAVPAWDGVWLVVADAPLDRYGARAIGPRLRDLDWVSRCAVAHAAVVERIARMGAVVPMKLFTIFSSDARAVADVTRSRRRIERLARRVAGRQEWSVRVALDEQAAARSRIRAAGRAAPARTGTGFLLRKKREKDVAREVLQAAVAEAARVYDRLGAHADDARRRTPAQAGETSRMLLDATYLVPTAGARAFRAAVADCARRLAPAGYRVSLTGPWPPYTFAAEAP